MNTVLFLSVLAALVVGRLYLGRLAADFISALPDEERRRAERSLLHGCC